MASIAANAKLTDLDPLAREPGVQVATIPPGGDVADAHAVVVAGTKNAVDDRLALRRAGFGDAPAAFDVRVVVELDSVTGTLTATAVSECADHGLPVR